VNRATRSPAEHNKGPPYTVKRARAAPQGLPSKPFSVELELPQTYALFRGHMARRLTSGKLAQKD